MKSKFHYIIPFYEMIGGILGVFITVYWIFQTPNILFDEKAPMFYRIVFAVIMGFVLVTYIMSFLAGLLLWREKKQGYVLSIIVQVFQIPYISSSQVIYTFISGAQLGAAIKVGADTFKFSFLVYAGSTFSIYFQNQIDEFVFGINILSLLVIRYLYKCISKKQEENIIIDSTTGGQPDEKADQMEGFEQTDKSEDDASI